MGVLDPQDELYDAFKRDDQYGDLGWKKQTLPEYARLAIFGLILLPLKLLAIAYFVLTFYLVCR